MALNSQEAAFIQRLRSSTHRLATEIDALVALNSLFFDRGYDVGGDNVIDNTDLGDLDITQQDLTNMSTAISQLENWRDNTAVTTGDYGATLNKVREL